MMLFTKINKLKFYKSINYCQLRYLLSADGKWVSFSSESENLDPEMPELPLIDILKKIESQWKSVINDYWKDALKDDKAKNEDDEIDPKNSENSIDESNDSKEPEDKNLIDEKDDAKDNDYDQPEEDQNGNKDSNSESVEKGQNQNQIKRL